MNLKPLDEKVGMTLPYLQQAGVLPTDVDSAQRKKLREILNAAADRIKVAGDILDYTGFFVSGEQLTYDEAAFEKRLRTPPEASGLLKKFGVRLQSLDPFDAPRIEKTLQDFVQEEGISHAQIIHALRLAATGKTVGFGLFESLAILGKQESLLRIDRALGRLR